MTPNKAHETDKAIQQAQVADLQLQIADAEASGKWALAARLKSEMVKASAPPKPVPTDEERASLDALRDEIREAENKREFARAGRLKTQLLRKVAAL